MTGDILTREPWPSVLIGLVPTTEGWQVPAFLRYGGGDCPMPAKHVSVLRYWHERWGAELVGLSGAVMELWVTRPPATRQEAFALAREQCAFCSDIVLQGTETLEVLAATLLHGRSWYFWWD